MADLRTDLGCFNMKNPLITASGTCGYGHELAEVFNLSLLGGISVKGTTLEPREGNPPPRIAETPSGLLNSVGLQNPGIQRVIETELPFLRNFNMATIVNIAGHAPGDYEKIASMLDKEPGIAALEVNISCPNVNSGGMAFGTDAVTAHTVISMVRKATTLPLMVKLSPNVSNIVEIALAVEAAGANIISLINTLQGMVIDIENKKPILQNTFGGLSGPAVKPVALRMVWQVSQAVKIPVVGLGGIVCAQDAVEFMMAGATAFQIGSALFRSPTAPLEIIEGLNEWLDNHGVNKASDIIGQAWGK